jgi:hypothetical protein
MELSEEQIQIIAGKVCPYCKQDTVFTDSAAVYGRSYGMIYWCKPCGAYVGVHKGTSNALGRLANKELRELKKKAHAAFDPLWKDKFMSRDVAYKWLSNKLNIPLEFTHIGMFGEDTCKKVIEISTGFMEAAEKFAANIGPYW